MEEKFVLTEEILSSAKEYMPIAEKATYAKTIAQACVLPKKTALQNEPNILPLPQLYFANAELKTILTGNVFLGFYLGIEIKNNENPEKTHDFFFSGHLFNQIERFKTNTALKEKVFNIIADFKDFKKMVDAEIQNEIENNNDVLGRLSATMALLGTPENIEKMTEALKNIPELKKKEA